MYWDGIVGKECIENGRGHKMCKGKKHGVEEHKSWM